jgi:hypothetical protein
LIPKEKRKKKKKKKKKTSAEVDCSTPYLCVSSFLFSHFEIHRPICIERETSGWREERLNDFINCIFYRPGSYNVSLHDELAMQRQ